MQTLTSEKHVFTALYRTKWHFGRFRMLSHTQKLQKATNVSVVKYYSQYTFQRFHRMKFSRIYCEIVAVRASNIRPRVFEYSNFISIEITRILLCV